MATMTVRGLDEYTRKLSRLGKEASVISKKAVYAGANIVADEVRRRLEENLKDPAYVGKQPGILLKSDRQSGDLLGSFGIAPIGTDKAGNTNTKIGFGGYDGKGVPNALKARAMESGTSVLRKRPFVRPAVRAVKARAQLEMGKVVEREIEEIYAL